MQADRNIKAKKPSPSMSTLFRFAFSEGDLLSISQFQMQADRNVITKKTSPSVSALFGFAFSDGYQLEKVSANCTVAHSLLLNNFRFEFG